jgi:DNA-binding beta-propeller fold protein YncE
MRKQILLMLCLTFGLVCLAVAEEPIGVFANSNTNCIQFIDPATQTVSDSLLKGSLGSYGGGLFDVVITSDGKTAIVSNFGDSRIFFIDISGGFNSAPTLLGQVKIPFFAEDMAITPDNKYVLVTDGGFATGIAVIEIHIWYENGKWHISIRVRIVSRPGVYSNAIAIAPDGQTVLTADYFAGKINLFKFNPEDGTLTYVRSQYVLPARPVNIEISPDGKTAIGVSATGYKAPVFALNADDMEFTGFVTLPHKSGQSCVFSPDGTKAYYLSNSAYYRAMIEVMDVTGPGQVTASGVSITARPKKGTSQLFGVDTIAIDPSGNYLYVANPTLSGGVTRISVIDLTVNAQVNYIEAGGIPTGITFATIAD